MREAGRRSPIPISSIGCTRLLRGLSVPIHCADRFSPFTRPPRAQSARRIYTLQRMQLLAIPPSAS